MRRAEKATVPLEHRPMHELVREYFNTLAMNDSSARMTDDDVNGRSECGQTIQPEE